MDEDLGPADELDQGEAGRADIGAGAALHAGRDGVALGHLRVVVARRQGELGGDEVEGTGVDAAATAHAVALLLLAHLLVSEDGDAAGAFGDGDVEAAEGEAHHGATGDDPGGVLGQPATVVDELGVGDPDGDEEVLGHFDASAGDGDHSVGEGLAAQDGTGEGRAGAHVDDLDAHVEGEAARGHFALEDGRDELFLAALGVLGLEDLHLDGRAFGGVAQGANGLRFVLFNANDHLARPGGVQGEEGAADH